MSTAAAAVAADDDDDAGDVNICCRSWTNNSPVAAHRVQWAFNAIIKFGTW